MAVASGSSPQGGGGGAPGAAARAAKDSKYPTRDEKLENLIMNHSMIFMGMFEEAFSTIAEKMTEAIAKGGAAMAEALGGVPPGSKDLGATDPGKKLKDDLSPEVRTQIGNVFSEIREEMASQWPKNASVFKGYISSPTFDKGIEIVEGYDFGRPRLTEKLSDELLASYVFLVQSGDPRLGKMFKELADWQSGLPKPPWAN
jgi:hypothetical protein